MKFAWQQSTWENATRANIALSIATLVLSLTTMMSIIYANSQHDRILLTPVIVDKQMTIDWNAADENYIRSFALSVAQMMGNLTPENSTFIIETMARFIDSSIYSDLRKTMLAVTSTRAFKEIAASSRYVPYSILYEHDTNKVFVTGMMDITSASGKESRPMTYEMSIRISGGQPLIYSFDSYSDTPHTKEWVVQHNAELAKAAEEANTTNKAQ
jgi:conjugal transfer pilus assembly protein TraE